MSWRRLEALVAGLMIAQLLVAKAAGRALFLDVFAARHLLWALSLGAVLSIAAGALLSWALARFRSERVIAAGFLASAGMHLLEWYFVETHATRLVAVVWTVHVTLIPLLISAFHSTLSDARDPRQGRRRIRRVVVAGSIGGVVGAGMLMVTSPGGAWEAVGARIAGGGTYLPLLAALHVLCAVATFTVERLAARDPLEPEDVATAPSQPSLPVMRRIRAEAPHLRTLATVVLLFAASAGLLEFVFSAHLKQLGLPRQEMAQLLSRFYALASLLSLGVHLLLAPLALRTWGIVETLAGFPVGTFLGSVLGAALPVFPAIAAARGVEIVGRTSLFRSAQEQLFIAVPSRLKKAAKVLIDGGFERMGDLLGYGLAEVTLLLPLGQGVSRIQLAVAGVLAGGTWLVLPRMNREYEQTLLANLEKRTVEPPSDVSDRTTRNIIIQSGVHPAPERRKWGPRIAELESPDADVVRHALSQLSPIPRALVGHVILLLARQDIYEDAIDALRMVAMENQGQLFDVLRDSGVDIVTRRRVPRVLRVCDSDSVVEGMLGMLEDPSFEIRRHCADALLRLRLRYPRRSFDRARVEAEVLRELKVSHENGVDRDNAARDHLISHVIRLLSLTYDSKSLARARHALRSKDPAARGAAVVYIEKTVSAGLRASLMRLIHSGGQSSAGL